jgi:hypothetical protein
LWQYSVSQTCNATQKYVTRSLVTLSPVMKLGFIIYQHI